MSVEQTNYRMACELYASIAMTEAVRLDPSGGHDE